MSVTVEQEAYEMPTENKKVMLKIDDVHLHSCGVFSNVYRGQLREPIKKEVAIKKTWPEKGERNFEFVFLTGRERMKHKNVIQMIYAFSHNYGNKICESYVFDYMPNTLADVLKLKLNDMDVRLYSWQIFSGLKYLEDHLVIHRDLKPVNVLVDHSTGLLKISDFGSAKVYVKFKPSNFYQVTRFYRPPELLLKSMEYDCAVDVWSAGCVIAEMIRRHVVFPGRDSSHQMKLYCRCFGAPTESEMKSMKAPDKLDSEYVKYSKGFGIAKLLRDPTLEQIVFLQKVLVYSPEKRLHGREALKDEFFKPLFKSGAARSNDQPISSIITSEDYRKATENDEASSKRFALLSLAMKAPKDQGIPLCEKSNSYENINIRRSTLIPREQKMAREQKSREENSREERSNDREKKCPTSEEEYKSVVVKVKSIASNNNGKKSMMTKVVTKKSGGGSNRNRLDKSLLEKST